MPSESGIYEQTIMLAEQLRNALNAIPAYTWYATPSGALIFLNEHAADYLNLPEDHPLRLGIDIGAAWDSHIPFLHPDDHDETRRVWSNCLKTGLANEVAFRVRDTQGRYRWRASRVEPLRASDGTLLFWVGINFDIEELKQTEFYLVEGQRLARTGSWAFNSNGFEFWSDQLFEIHGLKPDGKVPSMSRYMNLVHPEDRDFVAKEMSQALSNHRGVDFTKRIVRPDGVVRHVRCVGVPDSDGQRLIGTGIDVTEQEQLTKALREREEEVREILDLTPQLIAVFGPGLERHYVNRHALNYFGVTLHRWRNMETSDLLHPEDLNGLLSRWADAMTSGAAFETEVRFRKGDGSYRWFLTRCNPVRGKDGQILRWYGACTDIEDRRQAEDRLQRENIALRQEIDQASMFDEIIGSSGTLHKLLSQVRKVARSDSTVLVLGETGTGKELIARAIHKSSDRSARPFIGVNCGAIATSLFSSELFGHEKGAFTGATQRRLGRFEIANGGTIFLDEVGDLPSDIQIALLRVLQERTIERVGGNKSISIDVRVVAATHRDLEKFVSEGKFREDLYYRLNVVPITVPALRERAADIPLLVEYFIARFGKKVGKTFKMIERNTLKMLQAYDWPGNVRELQNVIERAVILSEADVFTVEEAWLKPAELHPSSTHLSSLLSAREKETIEAALAQSRGRVSGPSGAANMLGVPETTLDSKIKRLGIDKYRFKSQIN
jgi:formate hydrogenlyase transcriptional activator